MRRELAGKNPKVAEEILTYLDYTWGYKKCYWFMIGYIVFFFLLGWLILVIKARKL